MDFHAPVSWNMTCFIFVQIDPSEKLDPEVEDILVDIAEDFVDSVSYWTYIQKFIIYTLGVGQIPKY